ncbi:DUF3489 domain-containing protein [Aestuariivirga sp.]|uniref:DUF3489 domain-containing protein n=1 Tax=Aestuariivirga sp. TaxID=2650926 RepID=UPI0035944EF4
MTRLSDTQLIVLSAAAQRDNHLALPLPPNLKGAAAHKVINPLIEKGLLEEVEANRKLGTPLWCETGDGYGVTLVITAAGVAALGIESEAAALTAAESPTSSEAAIITGDVEAPLTPATAPKERKTRDGTKQAAIIAMLQRPEGATIEDLVATTGWQSHTVRGAMAGALKKKLGLTIESEKIETRGRVYKVRP